MSNMKAPSNYQTNYGTTQYGQFPTAPTVDPHANVSAENPPVAPNELPPPYSPPSQNINPSPIPVSTYPPAMPGTYPPAIYEIRCPYCRSPFMLDTVSNPLGRCPRCLRFSNISMYARHVKYRYLIGAIMFAFMGIISSVFTSMSFDHVKGLIVFPIVVFCISALLFARFLYLHLRKPEGPDALI